MSSAQAADGVECRGDGGAVRVQKRETEESLRGAMALSTMVEATDHPRWEGRPKNPRGGSSPMAFLSLTGLTQMAGLELAP